MANEDLLLHLRFPVGPKPLRMDRALKRLIKRLNPRWRSLPRLPPGLPRRRPQHRGARQHRAGADGRRVLRRPAAIDLGGFTLFRPKLIEPWAGYDREWFAARRQLASVPGGGGVLYPPERAADPERQRAVVEESKHFRLPDVDHPEVKRWLAEMEAAPP